MYYAGFFFTGVLSGVKKCRWQKGWEFMVRILIVEDQRIMQKYFESIIMREPEFRHVQTVSDACEAVKICSYSAIDLVLMDVQTFHNHDGLSAGKIIKAKISIYKGIGCYFADRSQGAGKSKERMCRQSMV